MDSYLLEQYQTHLDKVKGSIFSQPWWWDATVGAKQWSIATQLNKAQVMQGALPYYHGHKAGIVSWVRMPPLTPYLNFNFGLTEGKENTQARHQEKCVEQIIQAIPKVHYLNLLLHPDTPIINWNLLGLKSELELTYVLPSIRDHDRVLSHFESRARNAIRTAEKILTIRQATEAELYSMLEKTFAKQRAHVPFSAAFLAQLVESLHAHGKHLLLAAVDANEKIHAAALIVHDQNAAYNLLTGSDPALHQSGAVPFLLWQIIQKVSASVDHFDFEGGMIPNIASLYRSLGGVKKPYVRIYGSSHRLLEGALTALGKF